MNTIDSYRFGLIVINGKRYTSDVIITPDRVRDNWVRKRGHQLCLEDIADVLTQKPELLIVGTGASGMVRVPPEVYGGVAARNIKLVAEATDRACLAYNQLCHSQVVIAALHLTC